MSLTPDQTKSDRLAKGDSGKELSRNAGNYLTRKYCVAMMDRGGMPQGGGETTGGDLWRTAGWDWDFRHQKVRPADGAKLMMATQGSTFLESPDKIEFNFFASGFYMARSIAESWKSQEEENEDTVQDKLENGVNAKLGIQCKVWQWEDGNTAKTCIADTGIVVHELDMQIIDGANLNAGLHHATNNVMFSKDPGGEFEGMCYREGYMDVSMNTNGLATKVGQDDVLQLWPNSTIIMESALSGTFDSRLPFHIDTTWELYDQSDTGNEPTFKVNSTDYPDGPVTTRMVANMCGFSAWMQQTTGTDATIGNSRAAAQADPKVIKGIAHYHWKAESLLNMGEGDAVDSWVDSINGKILTHFNASNKPEYIPAGASGPTAVYFDGSNDILYSAASEGSSTPTNFGVDFSEGFTQFIVHKPDTVSIYRGPMTIASNSSYTPAHGTAQMQNYFAGTTGKMYCLTNRDVSVDYLNNAVGFTGLTIYSGRTDDGSGNYSRFNIWANGTETDGTGFGSGNPSPNNDGVLWFGHGYNAKYHGRIYEIILYKGMLTDAQIAAINADLNAKYGAY